MSPQLDEEVTGQIVRLRALDYNKGEIADELNISRNTVSRHLEQVQQKAEAASDSDAVALEAFLKGMVAGGAGFAVAKIVQALNEDEPGVETE